jgi:hypothetical protein
MCRLAGRPRFAHLVHDVGGVGAGKLQGFFQRVSPCVGSMESMAWKSCCRELVKRLTISARSEKAMIMVSSGELVKSPPPYIASTRSRARRLARSSRVMPPGMSVALIEAEVSISSTTRPPSN